MPNTPPTLADTLAAQHGLCAANMGAEARDLTIMSLSRHHGIAPHLLYDACRRAMGRNTLNREVVALLVDRHRLSSPSTSTDERSRHINEESARTGISRASFYRAVDVKRSTGAVRRRSRADKGSIRGIPEDVDGVPLRQMVIDEVDRLKQHPSTCHLKASHITRRLHAAPELAALNSIYPRELPDRPGERLDYNPNLWRQVRKILSLIEDRDRCGEEPTIRVEVEGLNDLWHFDDSKSDFFLQPRRAGDLPLRVPLSAVIDARSRCCLSAHYTTSIDSPAWSDLMFSAIRSLGDQWPMGGVPRAVKHDQGSVFISEHAERALRDLGVEQLPSHAHHPHENGKVERFFGLVHQQLEPELPGYCGPDNKGDDAIDPRRHFQLRGDTWWCPRHQRPLLTVEQANKQLHAWIVAEYHSRVHGSIETSPRLRWQQEAFASPDAVRMPPERALFEAFLVSAGTRVVRRSCVQLDHIRYGHPDLPGFDGMSVEVRTLNADPSRVWVFHDGAFCFEAAALPEHILPEGADRREMHRLQAQHRRRTKQIREFQRAVAAGPQLTDDPVETLPGAAAAAPALATPDPHQPEAKPERLFRGVPLRRAAGNR